MLLVGDPQDIGDKLQLPYTLTMITIECLGYSVNRNWDTNFQMRSNKNTDEVRQTHSSLITVLSDAGLIELTGRQRGVQ